MKDYRLSFYGPERDEVINIVRRTNDILINHIDNTSIGITIETDHADTVYNQLLQQLEKEVYRDGNNPNAIR